MRFAASRTLCTAGNRSPIKTGTMAITTNSSVRVNALLRRRLMDTSIQHIGVILLGKHGEPHFLVTPGASGSEGVFQIFTVPSRLAEASHLPSGLNATLSIQPVWPWRVRVCFVAVSHTLTVPS